MGEKETNAGLGQAPAETGANLREPSAGPSPEPAATAIVKSKSNITNN
ncbi:MAG: hypothetical protein ABI782_00240 [Anaerolineaceae bacterium]